MWDYFITRHEVTHGALDGDDLILTNDLYLLVKGYEPSL